MVGRGGVLGGELGEGGSEEMVMAAEAGLGRRRLGFGCVGRANWAWLVSFSSPSSSSSSTRSELVSSISSLTFLLGSAEKCGRR